MSNTPATINGMKRVFWFLGDMPDQAKLVSALVPDSAVGIDIGGHCPSCSDDEANQMITSIDREKRTYSCECGETHPLPTLSYSMKRDATISFFVNDSERGAFTRLGDPVSDPTPLPEPA